MQPIVVGVPSQCHDKGRRVKLRKNALQNAYQLFLAHDQVIWELVLVSLLPRKVLGENFAAARDT